MGFILRRPDEMPKRRDLVQFGSVQSVGSACDCDRGTGGTFRATRSLPAGAHLLNICDAMCFCPVKSSSVPHLVLLHARLPTVH